MSGPTINVKEMIGVSAVSADSGVRLASAVTEHSLSGQSITLDFAGVEEFGPEFILALGDEIQPYMPSSSIVFTNLTGFGRLLLGLYKLGRL